MLGHAFDVRALRPRRTRASRRAGRFLLAALTALLCTGSLAGQASAQDSAGTDFWLAFPGNFPGQSLALFITGDTATTGTVTLPGLAFSQAYTVNPGTVTTVNIPVAANIQASDVVTNLGIHVTAAAEVTVYGLNRQAATTDAYLGLPTDALGTDYINIGYQNVNIVNGTQFGLVAAQDATTVTITPSVTTGLRTAGVPYTVSLNQGQTYLLRNTGAAPADLSGSIIKSDKPIALFGGHQCANIPAGRVFCDYIVEQLPPTTAWGKNFVSMPLKTRLNGDTFRVIASTDGTTVSLNGAPIATLNRGQLHERIITGPAQITSDKPVLVMQYSNSTSYDGVTSDPFQMMIPPFEQFLASYTVSTPASGFRFNFINVVAPTSAVGTVLLDGAPIPAASYTPIGASGFSGAQVTVALGSHTLSSPQPFGVHSYGFDNADSYGYPGGLSLSEIARVTKVALAPKTATNPVGTDHCVTATVTDQNNQPLKDVRVDFTVTGVNPTSGFALTNASGKAEFCYHGTNAGDDTIKATVGALSDTASKKWTSTPPPDTTPPSCALTNAGTDGAGKKFIEVTAQDGGSGLASITVDQSTNATTVVPPFTPGTKSPVVVRATKINQAQTAIVALTVKDVAGNVTKCDPALVDLKIRKGHRIQQLVKGLAAGEHFVRITNGRPGMKKVSIKVNLNRFTVNLRHGQTKTINIRKAVRPQGGDIVRIVADGRKGSTISLVISD